MSWFKENTKRGKTNFLKETVEYADLHKAVLKRTMTTQQQCVKYDFVAPLKLLCIDFSKRLLTLFQIWHLWQWLIKGATKLYCTHYSCVVIIQSRYVVVWNSRFNLQDHLDFAKHLINVYLKVQWMTFNIIWQSLSA